MHRTDLDLTSQPDIAGAGGDGDVPGRCWAVKMAIGFAFLLLMLPSALRAVPARGQEAGTRVFALETTTGADHSPGPMQSTGRPLDVAVQGPGWIAVQGLDGTEAYPRAGNLQVGADGTLQLPNGLPVLSDGGAPIVANIPPGSKSEQKKTDPPASVSTHASPCLVTT